MEIDYEKAVKIAGRIAKVNNKILHAMETAIVSKSPHLAGLFESLHDQLHFFQCLKRDTRKSTSLIYKFLSITLCYEKDILKYANKFTKKALKMFNPDLDFLHKQNNQLISALSEVLGEIKRDEADASLSHAHDSLKTFNIR